MPSRSSTPSSASSPSHWLPMTTRCGTAPRPMRCTRTAVPAATLPTMAGTAKKPSAVAKLVTAPLPRPRGKASSPAPPPVSSPASSGAGRRAAMTNSVRPISDGMRSASVASTMSGASAGRPARMRMSGATKRWNVKRADVGNPGSTATTVPACTARQSGLPGFSATPCTITCAIRATTRDATSPAPLDVPPLRMTRSACASAVARTVANASSSSGTMPRGIATAPSSSTAAARVAALLS